MNRQPEPPPEPRAPDAGWEADRLDKAAIWSSATPAQRLAWLEEMIRLAWQSGALPRKEEAGERTET